MLDMSITDMTQLLAVQLSNDHRDPCSDEAFQQIMADLDNVRQADSVLRRRNPVCTIEYFARPQPDKDKDEKMVPVEKHSSTKDSSIASPQMINSNDQAVLTPDDDGEKHQINRLSHPHEGPAEAMQNIESADAANPESQGDTDVMNSHKGPLLVEDSSTGKQPGTLELARELSQAIRRDNT
jgi:hypothetical protein